MNEPVNYVLDNLHPFTEYNITVRCIPKQGGYWSDNVSKKANTTEGGKCNVHYFVYNLHDFKLFGVLFEF